MANAHVGTNGQPAEARAKTLGPPSRGDAEPLSPVLERRRTFRVEVPAEALLWRRGRFGGRYQLEDLSMGGCRISDGPPRRMGEPVEVLIRMPHHGALSLPGRIVRRIPRGPQKASLGLCFARPTATAEDWIHDVVLWALEGTQPGGPRTTLVVMRDRTEASHLVQLLRRMGRAAVAAHTPLDAVQLLVEHGTRIDVALLDEALGGSRGIELAQFLSHNHPGVHRVMLGDTSRMLSLLDAHTCGVAEGVLSLPADPQELHDTLRRLGCWMPVTPEGGKARC